MDPLLVHRARRHAALGEPVRLAIVDDLRSTDRSPLELARQFELPSNLLAHHLDVLEQAGLIRRVVSGGDRRRRYVQLVWSAVDGLGIRPRLPRHEVVFVCSGNSARSQLAAALWAARTGRAARSAGTHPAAAVHPRALAAARRAGLDLAGAEPRLLTSRDRRGVIVTVCDRAHEELTTRSNWLHWSLPDPVDLGTDDAFDQTVHQLDHRIATTGDRR